MFKCKLRKIWTLQPDGDLKAVLLIFILAKGPNALVFRKVKGNAKAEHIAEGIVAAAEALGNDGADGVADQGIYMHGPHANAIAKWLAARHDKYTEFMHCIHRIIVLMFLAEKEARDSKTLQNNPFQRSEKASKVLVPACLEYGHSATARKLQVRPIPQGTHKHERSNCELDDIRNFLSHF